MKKYTITDKEWESVLNKVQTLEKENEKLKGVIEGMNKAFSLYVVSKPVICTNCNGDGFITAIGLAPYDCKKCNGVGKTVCVQTGLECGFPCHSKCQQ